MKLIWRLVVFGFVTGLVGCAQESGTVNPQVQQMKPSARGKK